MPLHNLTNKDRLKQFLLNPMFVVHTVVLEIFDSKNISWVKLPMKISYTKIYYHNQISTMMY